MSDDVPSLALPLSAALDQLAARTASAPHVRLVGAHGPALGAAAARLVAQLPRERRPLVVVTPDEASAQALARDLTFFLPPGETLTAFPAVETSPYAELSPDRRAIMRRLAALFALSQGDPGAALVVSAAALMRRVVPRAAFAGLCDLIIANQELPRDRFAATLASAGYTRVPVVEDPGTYAVRGGVVDLFPPLYPVPVRVELFGDLVESIRAYDPRSQRTTRDLAELYVHPVRETVKTPGADLRARVLAAADAADHPSSKTRLVLEQLESGEDFFGIEALAPAFHAQLGTLAEYLPADATWLVVDPDGALGAVRRAWDDAETRHAARLAEHRLALPPGDHFLDPDGLAALLDGARHRIDATVLELLGGAPTPTVRLGADEPRDLIAAIARARAEKADELLRPLVDAIRVAREDGGRFAIVCHNAAAADRLRGLLAGYKVEVAEPDGAPAAALGALERGGPVALLRGELSRGFVSPGDGLTVLTDEEIFGARAAREREAPRQKKAARIFGDASQSLADLATGDYVVHTQNGVGRYLGLKKLPVAGTPIDFMHLEYEGGALYLPVYRLGEITRYVGADAAPPKLDRLGGVSWEKTKRKVSAEVKKMAEELLQLYAQRQALPGFAFPEPDTVFREFEGTFPFDETPDQQKAIDEVIADMTQPRPMDRLVCGDVGYGKTEVALRAAMLAALSGKQVAVLAPTTVLVEQHARNFAARLGGFPVRIAALSRFTPRGEQAEILQQLGAGGLDIVVGTHRLLSNDVRWRDLGLIVIDEEQRFGVAHKERLKKLRTQVDVLTLTATPIPRSLHLSLMGAREMSIIATPPVDRLAIRTYVSRPDDEVIKEALGRELARGGQAFFVCPRIGGSEDPAAPEDAGIAGRRAAQAKALALAGKDPNRIRGRRSRSLAEWAEHLRELVPGLRVCVGHGQLAPDELEQVMVDFVAGKFDVLCSTTIIESGLDIPRANTMFVDQADQFGLAQLYQLRGRIGRGKERAACYLMVPPPESLTQEARARLATLQRFTELGSGFMIASHDLEIRGAGDLLGKSQSGHIAAVGFDTYARILEEAVAELRGTPISQTRDPELNVDLPGFIPDDYVPDTGQRLDLYKRLAQVEGDDDVALLLEEMKDRWGEVPDEVRLLGELMIVKALGRRLGAMTIDLTAERLALALDERTPLVPAKVLALVNKKGSPYRVTPDMRLIRQLSAPEQKDRVRAAKRALLELQALC